MPSGRLLRPGLLALSAALIFAAECLVFHYPLAAGVDALGLLALILIPAAALALAISRIAGVNLSLDVSLADALVFLICTLIYFALYNLQQFHFMADGGIVTHGLFGVDIPWLAGEVHGLRIFGELRDLHQAAQLWQYHDATYRLLALFPRERTLADLALAVPLVGYTLLAGSVFALVARVTAQRTIAWFAVAVWFLLSGWAGLDQSSYALSPSYVFGSVIFVNLLLLLDVRAKQDAVMRRRILLDLAIVILLVILMETKLTTFLVLTASLGLFAVIETFGRRWKSGIELFAISVIPLAVFATQAHPNPLMPADDFLIGAPLMGYGNHVAALLHLPVNSLNPVTHAALGLRSLLIIPYFAFHFARFILTDPRILAAVIIVIVTGRKLVTDQRISRSVVWLLILMLPIGFLMPVLYSPAWYPLALSFYAPLVSVQAAVLLIAVAVGILWRERVFQRHRAILIGCAVVIAAGFGRNSYEIFQADRAKASVVTGQFVKAMEFAGKQLPDTALIATPRHDLELPGDECYFWDAALSGHPILSEGAKYGALLAASGDTDAAKGLHHVPAAERLLQARRALLDTIYQSEDSGKVASALKAARVGYLVDDGTYGSYETRVSDGFAGEKVFSNDACTIWKIRP